MFRFQDSWVVERTIFEFVNQGGCSCCGMSHGGMRAQDFMALCSDIETDDGKKEKKSIWPPVMRDEVWAERVRFRRLLKEGLREYRERFTEHETRRMLEWFRGLPEKERAQCFQMPKEELTVVLHQTYQFKPAYQVVLCAVIEQISHFHETGYTEDGGSDYEVAFEECLDLVRGAFVLFPEYYMDDEGLAMLFERFRELGGAHLLPQRTPERRVAMGLPPRTRGAEGRRVVEEDDEEEDNEEEEGGGLASADREEENSTGREAGGDTQSFRSDRRLIRVMIARYFADAVVRKYRRAMGSSVTSTTVSNVGARSSSSTSNSSISTDLASVVDRKSLLSASGVGLM